MSDQAGGEKAENTRDLQGQATLFDAGRAGLARRLESPVVDADQVEVERVFGRGRPRGATNIATKQRLELFARIGGDPMLASARILAMPTGELAGMLGCSAFDAEKFRQAERALILPYVISKRPLDVNLNDKTPPALHLHFPDGAAAGGAAVALNAGGAVALLAGHAASLARGTVTILGPDEDAEETEA